MRHRKSLPAATTSADQVRNRQPTLRETPLGHMVQVDVMVHTDFYFPPYSRMKRDHKSLLGLNRAASLVGMSLQYVRQRPETARKHDGYTMLTVGMWGGSWPELPLWWHWLTEVRVSHGWCRARHYKA